ncbi:MAG: dienelactone hydrolase family protein [Desulfobacterales bacterium]|nr:MAG: dienelactone hydrolase family protein [Desulfobacterales bacterium]
MKQILLAICILSLAVSVNAKVVSKPVEYTQNGTVLEGYLAYDDAARGKRPGVLVVHEWWGLNDYVRSRVDKLAQLGYVAFALDMYGKGVWTTNPAEAKELSGHLRGTPLLRERARAGLEILRGNSRVDPKRLAAIGYCFGGTTVLELAYSGADLAGVVSFHGGLTAAKPEDFSRIKARFLICHGADDGFISTDAINGFQEGMRKSGADWQMVSFGGAVHSFTNPDADKVGINGIAYNKHADERSWQYMQIFFKEIF